MTNGSTVTTATTKQPSTDGHTFMEAARRLAPRIRELAPSIERDRRLPEDLVQAGVACLHFGNSPGKGLAILQWLVTPAWYG